MKFSQKLKLSGVFAATMIAAMFSTSATATMNYSYSGGSHYSSSDGGDWYKDSDSSSGSDYDVKVSSWSDTGRYGKLERSDNKDDWGDGGVSVKNSREGRCWSNCDGDRDYTDNKDHNYMILFEYGDKFSMKELDIGHKSGKGSDVTIMAYTKDDGGHGFDGKSYGELGDGWKVVGHYNDNDGDGKITFNDDCLVSSSYWLVGSYNNKVGNKSGWSHGDDYVKVKGGHGCFKTHTTPGCEPGNGGNGGEVPEPATFALLGFGLFGMTFMRRRQKNSKDQLSG